MKKKNQTRNLLQLKAKKRNKKKKKKFSLLITFQKLYYITSHIYSIYYTRI